jgi:hypothetical protein
MDDRLGDEGRPEGEMPRVRRKRFSRRRIALIAVLTLVLAGGGVAAVTAIGEGSTQARHVHGGAVGPRDLAAAAAYLGVSEEKLASDLRSGMSLARVANATPGRSASGLVAALLSAKRERLASAGANAPARVAAEVRRSGPGSVRTGRRHQRGVRGGLSSGVGRLGEAAANYLGVSPARLQSELRSGRTLAQLANSTGGRSASGLISALVAAKRGSITASLSRKRLAPERARSIESRLLRRVTELVSRQPARG